MLRKTCAPLYLPCGYVEASMRPQRNAAENTTGSNSQTAGRDASMRPQRNAAENNREEKDHASHPHRFNEAAA